MMYPILSYPITVSNDKAAVFFSNIVIFRINAVKYLYGNIIRNCFNQIYMWLNDIVIYVPGFHSAGFALVNPYEPKKKSQKRKLEENFRR